MKQKIKPIPILACHVLQTLAQDACKNTCILTASSPLATDWKQRHTAAHEHAACESVQAYTWSAWLHELSKQCFEDIYLNQMQELHLWKSVIQPTLPTSAQASVQGLAKQAMQAYKLIKDYQISIQTLKKHANDETNAFIAWVIDIEKRLLRDKHYSLKADMAEKLISMLEQLCLPKIIILDGFETYTPAQESFLAHLQHTGIEIQEVQHDNKHQPTIELTACQDDMQESLYISDKIREILKHSPQARIGLLTQQPIHNTLKHALQQLSPNHNILPTAQQAIALPHDTLADSPIIQQALHLLSLTQHYQITWEDISILLRCPWIRGFQQEQFKRALLDAKFRSQNRHQTHLKSLTKSKDVQALPKLHAVLFYLLTWSEEKPRTQSMAEWIKLTQQLLQHSGFLQADLEHEDKRSDDDIQAMNTLHEAMSQLVAMDVIQEQWSWDEFISQLHTACAQQVNPQAALYPNVQLLPIQQAAGMKFDYIIIHGMNDKHFPPSISPTPLLPLRLQQELDIPNSHAPTLFRSYQWLWAALQQSASAIYITYAMQSDEQPMKPSSFISSLAAQMPILNHYPYQHWDTESFDDTQLIPIHGDDNIRGGTQILEHQSACPFRAFATHRLHITPLEETCLGIEAKDKGSLIHHALEYIWQQLLSQQALLQLDEKQQQNLIHQAIEYAWNNSHSYIDFDIQNIECKRMQYILNQWLTLEKERPPFHIEALEKSYHVSFPSDEEPHLAMDIKIDRIDNTENQQRLIIDYKTGSKQRNSDWLGERMVKPQLPIYALAAKVSAQDAVSFASVRSGKDMGFEGLSAEPIGVQGIRACDGKNKRPDDWDEVLIQWKQNIDLLAKEFVQGRCDVAPRDKNACQYCKMEAVCRIDELQQEHML